MTEHSERNFIAAYWHNHAAVRLAAYLFFVIFIAQAAWIYPAYKQFERDELNRLSYTGLAIMESMLTLAAADISPDDLKLLGETLSYNTPLKGARIYTYTGDLLMAFGEAPRHEPYQLHEVWHNWMTTRLEDGGRIEMAWLPEDSYSPYLIVARLDSTHVQAALDQFVAFLLKMVFSVTFVSTLLLMWILRRPSFRPWLEKMTGVEALRPSTRVR